MNFQVELTSYCDLTCGYCPNKDMQRERTFMSNEVWDAILYRYILPFSGAGNHQCPPTFIGHKDGEPLLNKKFPDRLQDLSLVAPEIRVDIYSHGLMLPKLNAQGRDFMQFLGTLPNSVRYMMSFHPYNHDGSSNDYSQTIRYLQDVLRNRRPINVEFITVSHKSKWVSETVQENWRREWVDYPVTVHSNCSINPWTGRIEEDGTVEFNGCPYADFGHWFFGVTGNIIACCLDLEEEIVLGNVLTDDPQKMYERTDKFYRDQRRIQENRLQVAHPVCANCYGQQRQDIPKELVPLGLKSA